jgi:4-aminobutyrate aminotransferase-like enzyme
MKFAHESAVTRIALESFGVSVLKIRPPMPFDDADGDLLVDVLDSALNDLPR